MIFSAAYATVLGTILPLISADSIIISDELNHNSIINAIRLSRPKDKKIYGHNNMNELESRINACSFRSMKAILSASLDKQPDSRETGQMSLPLHQNIRGKQYYQ